MDSHTIISLFSGIGGLDLGIGAAIKTRTVAYVEREITCARVLAERASEGLLDEAPIYSDIRTFPTEVFAGKVDGIIGGFPCQPFSVAGLQRSADDPRNMWPDTIRLIREIRPSFAFLENVPNLVVHKSRYFGTILGDLAQAGYDAEWGCFKASDVGAPHRRERLFILAYSKSERYGRGDCIKCGDEGGIIQPCQCTGCQVGSETEGCGSELAYARDTGLQGTTRYDCHEKGTVCAGVQSDGDRVRGRTGRGSNELAHSSYERLEGDGPSRQKECENESRTLPFYPPGPKDPRWGWITEHYPELAPALCKVHETEPEICELDNAWKIEDRMAALMMLGNAVVPAQAEHAFISLAERTSEGV